MMDFASAFAVLVDPQHEGDYQDHPADRGNWTSGKCGQGICRGTKYGISAAAYPNEDIAALTYARAQAIYQRDYWGPACCEQLPDAVRFDMFDTAVNAGVTTAIKTLQAALGVTVDGVFGPRTLAATKSIDPYRLLARFDGWRLDHLNDNPEQWATFGRGWAQRIAENLKRA